MTPSVAQPEYIEWCGELAANALKENRVSVPIIMCNGAVAKNTIKCATLKTLF